MSKSLSPKPIEIKISTVVAISAILHESDPVVLDAALKEMTGGTPDFFDDEFAVIDVAPIAAQSGSVNWPELIALLKSYRLNPVAVRNAAPEMEAAIAEHGLSLDTAPKPREVPVKEPPKPAPVVQPTVVESVAHGTPSVATMIIDTPVRAGQRIYARNADLIVTAAVNNGAEIIADGSIHIYAPLRGRALAGANGNEQARIFAMSLEAELVSIAGVYRTFESGFPAESTGKPTQVRRVGDRIDIQTVSSAAR